ncbi:hypothetical protein DdX_06789 [Ditylenchus destructor]|uniref:Uncharacterized protein n=1 Tax=Ditylenchus destructor TaxID=166010 RepID=A0AAD4R8K3_9BILA|nr:hypothetical protein DdX_06789 [Ditylenchus destructor]
MRLCNLQLLLFTISLCLIAIVVSQLESDAGTDEAVEPPLSIQLMQSSESGEIGSGIDENRRRRKRKAGNGRFEGTAVFRRKKREVAKGPCSDQGGCPRSDYSCVEGQCILDDK